MSLVTVGCKLPNGLILEMGSRGAANYKAVTLAGANAAKIVGGYGMTEVDAEFMAAWLKKYSWLPAVKNGAVFMHEDAASAQAMAIDNAENPSGFERLDPSKAPTGIEADPEHLQTVLREAPKLATSAARSAA